MAIKKRVKSLGEKLIPISPEFYDTERDEDLIADKSVLLPFNAFLMISQWVAFVILMWWYASPANNTPVSTIQVDWDYQAGTYNCTPMMKDQYWRWTFNFDTCQELARPPKASDPAAADDTVVWDATKKGWKYVPFAFSTLAAPNHGQTFEVTAGFKDQAAATKAKDDFIVDLKKKNTCGTDGNYESSTGMGSQASAWVILQAASGSWVVNPTPPDNVAACCATHAESCQAYDSDNNAKNCNADSCSRPTSATTTQATCLGLSGGYQNWDEWKDRCTWQMNETRGYMQGEWKEVVDADNCRYNHSPPLKDDMSRLAGVTDWSTALKDSYKLPTEFQNLMWQYSRSKKLAICEITREEAVAMFKLYYDQTYLCQYAKAAAPFGCEASMQLPISQCFSLAYANSLLLYTVFSTICVKIFFAAKKEPAEDRTSEAHVGP